MNKAHALLLVPIAFAGAFSAFPFVEPVFWPNTWIDILCMSMFLVPAYAYLIGMVIWALRWNANEQFLGLSTIGMLLSITAAFAAGVGSVMLVALD